MDRISYLHGAVHADVSRSAMQRLTYVGPGATPLTETPPYWQAARKYVVSQEAPVLWRHRLWISHSACTSGAEYGRNFETPVRTFPRTVDHVPAFTLAEELPDICNELHDLMSHMQDKLNKPTPVDERTMPMALKLGSDGCSEQNDEEKLSVARQLREICGNAHIRPMEAELLVQMIGSVVSSYPPGGDDIAYISSAETVTPYLVAVRATLSPPHQRSAYTAHPITQASDLPNVGAISLELGIFRPSCH